MCSSLCSSMASWLILIVGKFDGRMRMNFHACMYIGSSLYLFRKCA